MWHSFRGAGRSNMLQSVSTSQRKSYIFLTGALGLITTLGGRLCLGPLAGFGGFCPEAKRSGDEVVWPGFKLLIEPDCGCKAGFAGTLLRGPPSFGGRGLLRGSFNAVVEEEGVTTGDCVSRDGPACDGDAVPSFDSLFFDFDDLLPSFARESCSC
jgi:hypothetical protein